jgi:hypothetical protein
MEFRLRVCTGRSSTEDRLTSIQTETQTRMRAAGVTVATAVELDAALARLEQWGLLRPDASVRRAS